MLGSRQLRDENDYLRLFSLFLVANNKRKSGDCLWHFLKSLKNNNRPALSLWRNLIMYSYPRISTEDSFWWCACMEAHICIFPKSNVRFHCFHGQGSSSVSVRRFPRKLIFPVFLKFTFTLHSLQYVKPTK